MYHLGVIYKGGVFNGMGTLSGAYGKELPSWGSGMQVSPATVPTCMFVSGSIMWKIIKRKSYCF